MERYLAVVKNGVVDNLMVVDPADSKTIAHFGGLLLPEGSPVAIGWLYDGTSFTPPPAPAKSSEELAAEKQAAIDSMERATLMPRATREFMLGYAEATFTPEQLAANVGYQKVKALDNQIRALRAQL